MPLWDHQRMIGLAAEGDHAAADELFQYHRGLLNEQGLHPSEALLEQYRKQAWPEFLRSLESGANHDQITKALGDTFERFLELVASREPEAQDILVRAVESDFRRVVRGRLSQYPDYIDDTCQETLLQIFRTFDPARGRFRFFARSTARFEALNTLAHIQGEAGQPDDPSELSAILEDWDLIEFYFKELERFLGELFAISDRPHHVLVFSLSRLEGLKPSQIVEEYGDSTLDEIAALLPSILGEIHPDWPKDQWLKTIRNSLATAQTGGIHLGEYWKDEKEKSGVLLTKWIFTVERALRKKAVATVLSSTSSDRLLERLVQLSEAPHRTLAWGFCRTLGWPAGGLVQQLGPRRLLTVMHRLTQELYGRESEPQGAFADLKARMTARIQAVLADKDDREKYRPILMENLPVGQTRLESYWAGSENPAEEVDEWLSQSLKNLRDSLAKKKGTSIVDWLESADFSRSCEIRTGTKHEECGWQS